MITKSRKKTVLHVIDTTGPGGAETVFLDLAEECARQGYRSVALIRGSGWVEEQLKAREIEYYIRDCKGTLNFRFLYQLVKIVRSERVLQIQSHLLGSNVYTSLVGILLRIPVVATFHGHVDISENERFRNVKLGIIRVGAEHVVCVTEDLKESVNRSTSGWARLAPEVIPNGVNVAELAILPLNKDRLTSDAVVFGCLGNIRPAKNYRLALEFIAFLKKHGSEVSLLIAGDDTREGAVELKAYSETIGVAAQVKFLGFIEDVPNFFNSIDVFLMTSSSEGHPLALTQALAAGKPVISTRSGVEEVVPEPYIFLSAHHSAEALCEAYRRVLDEEQLTSFLEKGREFVRDRYSLEAMCARYLRLYGL